MKEKFEQQHINEFYKDFKNLSGIYNIEKVHQIINQPEAMASVSGKSFKPSKFIIMTSIASIGLAGLLLFGLSKNKSNYSAKIDEKPKYEIAQNNKYEVEINADKQEQSLALSTVDQIEQETRSNVSAPQIIDGNPYIIDLEFHELEKLGFQVKNYAVAYRNRIDTGSILFYSRHPQFWFQRPIDQPVQSDYLKPDSTTSVALKPFNFNLYLDTISNKDDYYITIKYHLFSHDTSLQLKLWKTDTVHFPMKQISYYPLFCSNLDGEVSSWKDDVDFNESNDTLVPVVVRFSRLDCDIKKDLIFWFSPNSQFFKDLPKRYSYLENEYERIKSIKRSTESTDLVNYNIDQWVNNQVNEVKEIDGEKIRMELSGEEIKNLGIELFENNYPRVNFISPERNIIHAKDTSDYLERNYAIKYWTSLDGEILGNSANISREMQFHIDNDVCIPIRVNMKEKADNYFWLNVTEDLWKYIPERYHYLKPVYNKIYFAKSLNPNQNYVKFFNTGKIDFEGEVSFIELSKKQLVDFGFVFNNDHVELTCEMDKEGLLYFHRPGYTDALAYPIDSSILDTGFHIIYITDLAGQKFTNIYSQTRRKFEQKGDLNYLIPIYVPFAEIISPKYKNQVLWFTPTEDLFNRLPNDIGDAMRKEYLNLDDNIAAKVKSCTYFEACKSTLALNDFKLFPNPASHKITIAFNTPNELIADINLTNISGITVQTLKASQNFMQGFNQIELELNDVQPGIYLLIVVTDKGFKSQRLVVNP